MVKKINKSSIIEITLSSRAQSRNTGSGRFYYFTIETPINRRGQYLVGTRFDRSILPFPWYPGSRWNLDIHQCSTVKLISVGITSEEWTTGGRGRRVCTLSEAWAGKTTIRVAANSSPLDGRTYDNTNRRWHMEHKIDTSGRSVDTSVTKVSGPPLDAFHDRVPRQADGIFSLVCARIARVCRGPLFLRPPPRRCRRWSSPFCRSTEPSPLSSSAFAFEVCQGN